MQKQLAHKNLEGVFVTEGDKNDLSPAVLDRYFRGKMATVCNATSCAYKHILAYKKIAEGNDSIALVLEDDIRFYPNYPIIESLIRELKKRDIKNMMISIEDSNLKYIPKSQRIKGDYLYPKPKGRLAGAYLIDKQGARNLLKFIEHTKLDQPIDWFHNFSVSNGILKMFWSQPALAVQGSLDGTIKSLIDSKQYGWMRTISFKIQRFYKIFLYFIR